MPANNTACRGRFPLPRADPTRHVEAALPTCHAIRRIPAQPLVSGLGPNAATGVSPKPPTSSRAPKNTIMGTTAWWKAGTAHYP
jgi:hypothetical protein